MNNIGYFLAYVFIDADAEAWLAETDAKRRKIIEDKGIKNKWIFYIYDALWTIDFLLHAIAIRFKMFFSWDFYKINYLDILRDIQQSSNFVFNLNWS